MKSNTHDHPQVEFARRYGKGPEEMTETIKKPRKWRKTKPSKEALHRMIEWQKYELARFEHTGLDAQGFGDVFPAPEKPPEPSTGDIALIMLDKETRAFWLGWNRMDPFEL